jgi:hypothetical protein
LTRANKKKQSPQKEEKSFGRRVGENIRAAGDFGREAVARPENLPGKAHGALRAWFRRAWDVRGGGLYAVGFAAAFLILEINEIFFDDIPQFIAMNNVFSSELIGFGIEFIIDTFVNFVMALLWPVYVVTLWPPAGAIALGLAFVLFPRYLKKPIERWLFHDT